MTDSGTSETTDTTTEATSTVTDAAADETKSAAGETKAAAVETKDAKTETKVDPKAEAAKLEKAAAAIELKLPAGLDPKDTSISAFKKHAAEAGLDSAKAQKLFDAHRGALDTAVKAAVEKQSKDGSEWLAGQRKEWRETVQKDTEFGGAKYKETVAAISRVFNKYGASDKELRTFLNDGAGDHPALVKFLARIGRDMAEDSTALKTKPKNGTAPSADAELRGLFPNSKELFT